MSAEPQYREEIDRITQTYIDCLIVNSLLTNLSKYVKDKPEAMKLLDHIDREHFQKIDTPEWFNDEYVVINLLHTLAERYKPQ